MISLKIHVLIRFISQKQIVSGIAIRLKEAKEDDTDCLGGGMVLLALCATKGLAVLAVFANIFIPDMVVHSMKF